MASKTPHSLFAQIRSAVSALGGAAGRTVRRVRDTVFPAAGDSEKREPPPSRAVVPPPLPSAPVVEPLPKPASEAPVPIAEPPRPHEADRPQAKPSDNPFGDTIAALRAVRRTFGGLDLWPLAVRPWRNEIEAPPIPTGARFDRHEFTCSAGSRDYRLYVPATSGARPNGLVVMLHGCRQTPEDFALGTRMNAAAEARGLLVVYPHQPRSANANGCWNWYRLADQRRHGGEPAIIAGIVQELMDHWGLERSRVFVAGLSAGGAMTAILTHTHPELFGAACVHSGVATGLADDLASGLAAMRGRFHDTASHDRVAPADFVPTIVFQGDADRVVHPSNGDRLFADLDPDGDVRVETRDDGGVVSTVTTRVDADGGRSAELWHVAGGPHAWFGGDPEGSYAVETGPDATTEMLRFFAEQGRRRQSARDRGRRRGPFPTSVWNPLSQRDVR